MARPQPPLPWLAPAEAFPDTAQAWPAGSAAPGLLAAGGTLDTPSLLRAYQRGIFPWYSSGQPILWWSPDPRMVLHTAEFRLHRSLRKVLTRFRANPRCEIRFDHDFAAVVRACSATPRDGQSGTWIVPEMVTAYAALHRTGYAHSVEAWIDGALAGGLYCVGVGRAVFGESMFSHRTDASKIALAALVAFARAHGITAIDCQQNTTHLASLGAREIRRADFAVHVEQARAQPAPAWHFDPIYWNHLFPAPA
ncbi:MAG TPA: leucyl/phenylalanyl-tRNA--protein transferase [Burkholderiaceae bacterium]